jgi:hypothetical protein
MSSLVNSTSSFGCVEIILRNNDVSLVKGKSLGNFGVKSVLGSEKIKKQVIPQMATTTEEARIIYQLSLFIIFLVLFKSFLCNRRVFFIDKLDDVSNETTKLYLLKHNVYHQS